MKTLIGLFITLNMSVAFAGQGTGGTIREPVIPSIKFNYKCTVTWIVDGGKNTDVYGAIISRAQFELNNEVTSIDLSKLDWNHGSTAFVDPFQEKVKFDGAEKAFKQSFLPKSVDLYFDYSNLSEDLSNPKSFIAMLSFNYSLADGKQEITSGTRGLMSDAKLIIESRNRVGDYNLRNNISYSAGIHCEK